MTQQNLSSALVIIGMLNGMIGGVILVLPLLVVESGWLGSGLVITLTGVFSYYSCMLCIKHLGNYADLDQSIMHHFNSNKYIKIFYDFIVFLNLFLLLILYFELIVQQWEGMSHSTILNPILNFCLLLVLVIIMKYFQFGVSLLAYGIVSCAGYCLFLIWMLGTAPAGEKRMQKFGGGAVTLAASMGQAFSIQTIFIPILRKNRNQGSYQEYTLITFLAGFSIYMYIGYMGAFGIVNRQPVSGDAQTIEGYFSRGYWQLYSLQIIYLIHLYSVFPEFLLISNKRFFSIFGHSVTPKATISVLEVVYIVVVMTVCVVVGLLKVEIGDIIEINGAVVGFFFIYFLPAITHIKCLYFPTLTQSPSPQVASKQKQIQITNMPSLSIIKQQSHEETQSLRTSLLTSTSREDTPNTNININQQPGSQESAQVCQCSATKSSMVYTVFDGVMVVGMLAVGGFVMYQGVRNVAT